GFIDWVVNDADPRDIDVAASTTPADGAGDLITIGSGNALVVGGQGADTIVGGTGFNVIIGDSGQITSAVSDANRFGGLPLTLGRVETTAPTVGGDDHISTGDGNT